MKILFKRNGVTGGGSQDLFDKLGISVCYLKYLSPSKERANVSDAEHHHTSFEVHIIEEGYQFYRIDNEEVRVDKGRFLLISPLVKHVSLDGGGCNGKFALTFKISEDSPIYEKLQSAPKYLVSDTPCRVNESADMIMNDKRESSLYSSIIIQNRVLEITLNFLGMIAGEFYAEVDSFSDEDERFSLAKQYIVDNITSMISVSELALYCCIGKKQLERIFKKEEGICVGEYVRRKKCEFIERLLADPSFTLKEISEMAGFQNEYYFNSFFKRHAGMSPGAFRKTVIKHI